jgi:hypothetical protein
MYQTVTQSDFIQAFRTMGRSDNFSKAGLCALFDYCEQLAEDLGEDYELDVIALCCDFSEYDLAELRTQYPDEAAEAGDDDEALLDAIEREAAHLIRVNSDTVIIHD